MCSLPGLLLLATLALGACAAQAPAVTSPSGGDGATAAQDATPDGRGGASGPGTSTAAIPAVRLGSPFQLPYDHLVRAGDSGVRLRFDALLEDSRCPRGVNCVWAGRARVRIQLAPRHGDPATLELGTEPGHETATAAGLTLELRGVEPAPLAGAGERTPAERYVLTLVARRAG